MAKEICMLQRNAIGGNMKELFIEKGLQENKTTAHKLTLFLVNKELCMDSRDIALFFRKRHDHVIRDIRNMLSQMTEPTFGVSKNYERYYKDASGKRNLYYLLPEVECLVLASGYSVKMRERIVREWLLLKKEYQKARVKSKELRNDFTDTLRMHGYKKQYEYIQTTKQMKKPFGIENKKDEMTKEELTKICISEWMASLLLDNEYGYSEVNPICIGASNTIKSAIENRKQIKKMFLGVV